MSKYIEHQGKSREEAGRALREHSDFSIAWRPWNLDRYPEQVPEYDCTETDLSIGVIVGNRTVQPGRTERDWYEGPTFMADIGAAKRADWCVQSREAVVLDHQLTSEES